MQFALDLNAPSGTIAPGRKAEPARARRGDPETSKRAAAKVNRFAGGHFAKILKALERGPGTYREIASRAELEPVAVARRLAELEGANKVKRDGMCEGFKFTRWALA